MQITDIRLKTITDPETKIKAVVSVTIDDCLVIHDIKVIEGESGVFVVMPSRKKPDGTHKDIAHPINTETREYFTKTVLEAYNKTLTNN